MNNVVLFRNTDLAPDAPATIEDMVAAGKELGGRQGDRDPGLAGRATTATPTTSTRSTPRAAATCSARPTTATTTRPTSASARPGSVEAYEKIGALGEKGQGVLKRSITTDNAISLFTDGQDRRSWSRARGSSPTLDDSGITYEISPVPGFEGMDPASPFVTVDAMYVASKGENKTLAQEFVTNYWSRPDVAAPLYEADHERAGAHRRRSRQIEADNPTVAKIVEAGATNGQIMPSIPEMAAVWDPLGKAEAAVSVAPTRRRRSPPAAKAIEAAIKRVARRSSPGLGRLARARPSRSTAHGIRPHGSSHVARQHRIARRAARPPRLRARRRRHQQSRPALIVKIVGLGLVAAIARLRRVPADRAASNWIGLAILVVVTALIFYVYLSPRARSR